MRVVELLSTMLLLIFKIFVLATYLVVIKKSLCVCL